jgi:hypothetical protein
MVNVAGKNIVTTAQQEINQKKLLFDKELLLITLYAALFCFMT